jgi:hypothetical protein
MSFFVCEAQLAQEPTKASGKKPKSQLFAGRSARSIRCAAPGLWLMPQVKGRTL